MRRRTSESAFAFEVRRKSNAAEGGRKIFPEIMKPAGADLPVVVSKWYAYAKWVLERVESFPKSQRFILGQRLSNHVMNVL